MFEFFKRKPKEETAPEMVSKTVFDELSHRFEVRGDIIADRHETLKRLENDLRCERETVARLVSQKRALRDRLNQIAALETPNCAHIGKRMARIARGEDAQAREKQAAE